MVPHATGGSLVPIRPNQAGNAHEDAGCRARSWAGLRGTATGCTTCFDPPRPSVTRGIRGVAKHATADVNQDVGTPDLEPLYRYWHGSRSRSAVTELTVTIPTPALYRARAQQRTGVEATASTNGDGACDTRNKTWQEPRPRRARDCRSSFHHRVGRHCSTPSIELGRSVVVRNYGLPQPRPRPRW